MPSQTPETHNGILPNYFQFKLEKIPNIVYFCQSVNLPGIRKLEVDQPTILSHPIRSPVGAIRFEDLVMTFKVDENLFNWLEIHKWIQEMSNYTDDTSFIKQWDEQRYDGELIILNSRYLPTLQVKFRKLFPIKLDGLAFNTVSSDSVELFCTVTFAYSDYAIERFVNP